MLAEGDEDEGILDMVLGLEGGEEDDWKKLGLQVDSDQVIDLMLSEDDDISKEKMQILEGK